MPSAQPLNTLKKWFSFNETIILNNRDAYLCNVVLLSESCSAMQSDVFQAHPSASSGCQRQAQDNI
jgi:hypothetical protein